MTDREALSAHDCELWVGTDENLGKVCFSCCSCGEPIYEGDTYYNIDGELYCEQCIEYSKETAELEDY